MRKLTPKVWDEMSEDARQAYAERNHKLWELVRAIDPSASGIVDEEVEKVIENLRALKVVLKALGLKL
jgi:hypothetical protein